VTPRDKLSGVAVCIWVSRFWVEPWPKLDLGVFRVCFHQLWRLLESLCSNLVIALVRPHRPPTPGTVARSLSTSWRRRSSCVLRGYCHSEGINRPRSNRHPGSIHLGRCTARHSGIPDCHLHQSIDTPSVCTRCPGGRYTTNFLSTNVGAWA